MSIIDKSSKEIIKEFGSTEQDTGSTEVQIALLTKKINNLTVHLKVNRKDYSSQRGLIKLVSQRRKLSKYLTKIDPQKYEKIKSDLGLRK